MCGTTIGAAEVEGGVSPLQLTPGRSLEEMCYVLGCPGVVPRSSETGKAGSARRGVHGARAVARLSRGAVARGIRCLPHAQWAATPSRRMWQASNLNRRRARRELNSVSCDVMTASGLRTRSGHTAGPRCKGIGRVPSADANLRGTSSRNLRLGRLAVKNDHERDGRIGSPKGRRQLLRRRLAPRREGVALGAPAGDGAAAGAFEEAPGGGEGGHDGHHHPVDDGIEDGHGEVA